MIIPRSALGGNLRNRRSRPPGSSGVASILGSVSYTHLDVYKRQIYKTRSWTPMYNPSGTFYTFEGFDNPAQVLEEGGMVNKTCLLYTSIYFLHRDIRTTEV